MRDSNDQSPARVVSPADIARRLWAGRYLLLAGAVIGGVVAFLTAIAAPTRYEAVTTLLVRQASVASPTLATNSMRAIIANHGVAAKVIKQAALPLTPAQFLRESVRIEDVPGTFLMRVAVRTSDAETSARVANLVAEEAIQLNATLMGTGADRLQRVMQEELAAARKRMNESEVTLTDFRRKRREGQASTVLHDADIEEARLHAEYDLAARLYEEIAVQYGKLRLQVAEQAAELMVVERAYPPEFRVSAQRAQRAVFGAVTGVTLTAVLLVLVALFSVPRIHT